MSVLSAYQSLKNLGSIWEDDDLSDADKMV
jgi:hypothetical protein